MREIESDRGPEEKGTALGRGRKENARGKGKHDVQEADGREGKRVDGLGVEARKASGQGGCADIKKKKKN